MFDCNSEEVQLQCPYCPAEKESKLFVNIDKGVFNCFRCGYSGKISKLATQHPNLYSKLEDVLSVAAFARLKAYARSNAKATLATNVLTELRSVSEIAEDDPHYQYLLDRGWDDELINLYAPMKATSLKYKDRVIIPVVSPENEIIYFTARDITGDAKMKYLNPVRDKDFVFASKSPLDSVQTEDAFICEGIFDAFKIPGACALLGKSLNKTQHTPLYNFLKSRKNIYICFDPGTAKDSLRLARELDSWFCGKQIRLMNWVFDKDDVIDLGELSKLYSSKQIMRFIRQNSREAQISNWFTAKAMTN